MNAFHWATFVGFQTWNSPVMLLLALVLLVASVLDIITRRLPDLLLVPALVLAVYLSSLMPAWELSRFQLETTAEGGAYFAPSVMSLSTPQLPGAASEGIGSWLAAVAFLFVIVVALQPGQVLLARGNLRRIWGVWLESAMRRGVFWIAVPLTLIGGAYLTRIWWIGTAGWQAALQSLCGATVGGALSWAVHRVGARTFGREAFGTGDVLLLTMIGAFVGWQATLVVLIATLILVPLALALWHGLFRRRTPTPLAPLIAFCTLVVVHYWSSIWPALEPIFATSFVPLLGAVVLVTVIGIAASVVDVLRSDAARGGRRLGLWPLQLALLLLIPSGVIAGLARPDTTFEREQVTIPWVAKAGGAFAVRQGDETLVFGSSNSLEAVAQNYQRGVRWFEIDLSLTSDGQIACVPGWGQGFTNWFAGPEPDEPLTLAQFRQQTMKRGVTQLDGESLVSLAERLPEATFLLDSATSFPTLVENWSIPEDRKHQFVPLLRDPSERDAVTRLGFDRLAITLNHKRLRDADVVELARDRRLVAIVAHRYRFGRGTLTERLKNAGIFTLATAVEDVDDWRRSTAAGAITSLAAWMPTDRRDEQ